MVSPGQKNLRNTKLEVSLVKSLVSRKANMASLL